MDSAVLGELFLTLRAEVASADAAEAPSRALVLHTAVRTFRRITQPHFEFKGTRHARLTSEALAYSSPDSHRSPSPRSALRRRGRAFTGLTSRMFVSSHLRTSHSSGDLAFRHTFTGH